MAENESDRIAMKPEWILRIDILKNKGLSNSTLSAALGYHTRQSFHNVRTVPFDFARRLEIVEDLVWEIRRDIIH